MVDVNENKVVLSGIADTELEYSHNCKDDRYYKMVISVLRRSGTADAIPVYVESKNVDFDSTVKGKRVHVVGQMRTRNVEDVKITGEPTRRLIVYVLASAFSCLPEEDCEHDINDEYFDENEINDVEFEGYIVRNPVFRTTPLGREITDVVIAVNGVYSESYIPCILWGNTARTFSNLLVGDKVKIYGRFQSRTYMKYYPEQDKSEERVTYEISAKRFDVLGENNSLDSEESSEVENGEGSIAI